MRNIGKILIVVIILVLPSGIAGQKSNQGEMPQYFFGEFAAGKVIMKSGQVLTHEMNYNMVTHKMVFVRGGKYYDMSNPDLVDTVYLQECKFIPVGNKFFELMLSDTIDLFAEYKGEVLPAGKPAAYGGTSQVSSSNYLTTITLSSGQYNLPMPSDYIIKVTTIYWIRKGDEMLDFTNEKQFMKLFPDKLDLIRSFIKGNKIKFDNPDQLIKLIKYCGTL